MDIKTSLKSVQKRLLTPIDIAPLVFFRMFFGFMMFVEVLRYVEHGWIEKYYIAPSFFFSYYGFEWVTPFVGDGMYLHFVLLGILSLCIMFGLFYRLSTVLFFISFSYVFLLEQAHYLNHFYLIMLISFLMIFIPAHRSLSLDGLIWPKIRSEILPAWTLWILRVQLGIAYFYGGIAKLNADWLSGHSLSRILPDVYAEVLSIDVLVIISWGIALFLLSSVPLLLYKKTRIPAFLIIIAFHIHNHFAFSIGIFPWFMIGATLLFFPPSLFRYGKAPSIPRKRFSLQPYKILFAILTIFFLIQVTIPFRHVLYPGNVSFTEEGHRFSWHMKLRTKKADADFYVHDSSRNYSVKINPRDYLTSRQRKKMEKRPDMILQFAHHVEDELLTRGYGDVEFYAYVRVSLNGRDERYLIDPTVDLTKEERNLRHADWILLEDDDVHYENPFEKG